MPKRVIWNLSAPLVERAPLQTGPEPTLVQFAAGESPTDRDHRLLGEFLATHPATEVRLYGAHIGPDLSWLRYYTGARRVTIDLPALASFDQLELLNPDLKALTLGSCSERRTLSLKPLRHFRSLQELTVVSHRKDIEVIASLTTLERLTLTRVTLPDLDMLRSLTRLREFELKLGGTRNLEALPHIGHLRYLEIWRVNRLADLSAVAELPELEYLFLQHLKHLEHVPSLAACRRLRRVHLDRVGIRDLAPIAAAPSLEELLVIDMPHLSLEAFRPFVGHPCLRGVTAGVGSNTRRKAIGAMLGLDEVRTYGTEFEFSGGEAAV